jgi:hypothetical protein
MVVVLGDHIDLNLAINYVPACIWMGKMFVLLLVCELLEFLQLEEGIVFVLFCVCFDRIYANKSFFDGNILLLFQTFRFICVHIQKHKTHKIPVLDYGWNGICISWSIFSFYAQYTNNNSNKNQLLNFCISGLYISLAPFVQHHDLAETVLSRVARGLLCGSVCVFWTYVIGIYQKKMVHLSDSGLYFIIYFGLCLFAPMLITIIYCATVFMVVVWKTFISHQVYATSSSLSSDLKSEEMPSQIISTNDLELEELQSLLRQAKEQKGLHSP